MKTRIPFFTLMILSFVIVSCSKSSDECTNGDCAESPQWEWVRSYGTIAGSTWTPESTNTTKSLFLDETTIVFFEKGEEVNRFDYEVFTTDTIDLDGEMRKFISYNGSIRRYNETSTELSMIDLCCDGLDDYYERK